MAFGVPDVLLMVLSSFVYGLTRGLTICLLVCAPGLIAYISIKRASFSKSFKYALIFNLPRIIILTLATFYLSKVYLANVLLELFMVKLVPLNILSEVGFAKIPPEEKTAVICKAGGNSKGNCASI